MGESNGLIRRGLAALRANDIAPAIELLSQAVERDASDPQAKFQLGIALQAAGRHAEALPRFEAARASLGDDPLPFLHAAVSRLALGDNQAALVAASEACWRAPKLPAAHYAYGQAFAALGDAARAEQAFAAAIQLNPPWADAWVNYGLARYRQGAVEDAKVAMRRALAADPAHSAMISTANGTTQSPPQSLRSSMQLIPDRPLVLYDLARLGPTPPPLAPLLHWRFVVLAIAEGDRARACEEAESMELALADVGPEAVPEHAIMARFDLAKFWSAKARRAAPSPIGPRGISSSRDSSRSRERRTWLSSTRRSRRSAPRASTRERGRRILTRRPCSRSGTTLVEQILAAHRDVFGAGERTALGQAFAALGGGAESRRPRGALPRSTATVSIARRPATWRRFMRLSRARPASSTRCPATFSISGSSA